jgi:CheY-like chemotaxis protein
MRTYHVLMIEDDIDDRYITDKYFFDNGYDIKVEYLSAENILSPARMPHLILMSGKYGLDLLAKLKSHETFRPIPVVILTEMSHPFNIADAYRLGANSVIIKPSTHELTKEKIQAFSKYWFSTVELSPQIQ